MSSTEDLTTKKKILVVDDEPDLARVLADIFTSDGYVVETAHSGEEALEKIARFQPDVIALDLLLPDMTGTQLIAKIQKAAPPRPIPVVMISTLDDPSLMPPIEKNAPLMQFLTKPLDTDRLLASVRQAVRGSAAASSSTTKIVVVDDDKEFTDMLRFFLERKGFSVVTANQGGEALELIKREQPRVVLMDLMLPDGDGFHVIDALKKDVATRDIPILVLTALRLQGILENGLWVTLPRNPEDVRVHREGLLRQIERQLAELRWFQASPRRFRVLVADDEEDINRIMQDFLRQESFDVIPAYDGEEALKKIYSESPDAVILDVKMPRLDGYEVCRRIKEDVLLNHLPVILLTVMQETSHKVRGLDSGADDYITKPFVPEELAARLRMVLRRTSQTLEANPLTHLPGNVSIERRINRSLRTREPFAVLYVDLNHFKAYNDKYGFERGDHVIRATARVVLECVRDLGGGDDFVGHIGGDDFIVVTTPETMESFARHIIRTFDAMVPGFYDPADRDRGFIVSVDRQGKEVRYPILGVSIGIVSNLYREIKYYGEVGALGAEMKNFAKRSPASDYKVDRRRN